MALTPMIICVVSGLILGFGFGCSGLIRGLVCGIVITVDAGILTGSVALLALVGVSFVLGCAIAIFTPANNWLKHEFDVRQPLVPPTRR